MKVISNRLTPTSWHRYVVRQVSFIAVILLMPLNGVAETHPETLFGVRHTVAQFKDEIARSGDHVVINWLSTRDDSAIRPFTHFAYSPHIREIAQDACNACHATEGEECMQCHTIKSQSGRDRPEFFDRDWAPVVGFGHFSSDFRDLATSNCARCHNNSVSRNDGLTCHKYHVRQGGVQPAANIGCVAPSVFPQIDVHELP